MSRWHEVTKDLRYDRIILCTGFRFDASIFRWLMRGEERAPPTPLDAPSLPHGA